jgi:hypothetical protein
MLQKKKKEKEKKIIPTKVTFITLPHPVVTRCNERSTRRD